MQHFDKFSLLERFEIAGIWWVPGLARRKVQGKLVYEPGQRTSLNLEGIVHLPKPRDNEIVNHPKVILGRDEWDRPMSLLNCFVREINGTRSVYSANLAILGMHVRSFKGIRLKSCAVEYTCLEEWSGYNPFKTHYAQQPDEPERAPVS